MNSKRLAEATTFATIAHKNDNRKGTNIPYVSHAIEAGLIAMTMTTDEDVIIAAFLHDIVEDTPYELSDIEERFGKRVAQLVAYESEDKMKVGIVTCNFASLKNKYSKEYFKFVLDTCMEIIKSFVENDFIDITNEHVLLK